MVAGREELEAFAALVDLVAVVVDWDIETRNRNNLCPFDSVNILNLVLHHHSPRQRLASSTSFRNRLASLVGHLVKVVVWMGKAQLLEVEDHGSCNLGSHSQSCKQEILLQDRHHHTFHR
jgi:hypothetical protein